MAVLPPPSTITRLPIVLTWPNDTEASQSMPMWMLAGGLLAARNLQVAPARRAAADEDRVIALRHQRLHRFDALVVPEVHAQVEDVAGLLVDHRLGQAEARDLGADEAAGLGLAVEHRDVVAERSQVARHRQRGRAGADAGDALAVLRARPWACARRRRPSWSAATRFRRQIATGSGFPRCSPRPGRAGRPARRGGRRCGRARPGRRWRPS